MANDREGVVACVYGPSGIGKTVDTGYSFPRALFIAAPGALTSIKTTCGYQPAVAEATTIEEATKLLGQAKKSYSAIVFDDFSFIAEQTISAIEKKKTGFALWGAIRDQVLHFRNEARYAGIDVVMSCWEQPPKVNPNGAKIKGGPMLPGKLPEQVPAMCDIVLRAGYEPKRQPWHGVYRCSGDPSFTMKDRFNIAQKSDPAPMNLAEILRAAGLHIPRLPDMEKNEEIVQVFSDKLITLEGADLENFANDTYSMLLSESMPEEEAIWILRDALDRSIIRKALTKRRLKFFQTAENVL